jgi:hypothetical protein
MLIDLMAKTCVSREGHLTLIDFDIAVLELESTLECSGF